MSSTHAMTAQTPGKRRPPADEPGPGLLGRLGGLAFRNRGKVVLSWLAAIVAAIGLSATSAGDFTEDPFTPGSDSQQAQDVLDESFTAQAGTTIDVVVSAEAGVEDPAVREDVTELLAQLGAAAHVGAVEDPYTTQGGVAPDGQTLLSRLALDMTAAEQMPVEATERLIAIADNAERPGLDVALGGSAVELAETGEVGSEMIGLVAAAFILLFTFGSVVAAGLPLIVAIAGLGVSAALTGLLAAAIDVPEWSSQLAMMLGIALGIDYTLLMVTRFREWRTAGLDPETATVATLDTAGRSVVVAGSTVVVSLLGLFAMGLAMMRGAAVVTIAAVLVVMLAAATLYPALLGYFGARVDRLRLPVGHRRSAKLEAGGHVEPGRGWVWWSRLVNRHSIAITVLAGGMLITLAVPFLDARFGFPDAGNNVEESSSRQAYDMVADSFGAGVNGPLVLTAELQDGDGATLDQLVERIERTPEVASVLQPQLSPDGGAALVTAIPTTGPQHVQTEDLVRALRDEVIPAATAGSGVDVHVGGHVAMVIDSNEDIAQRLPFLIGGVVTLSMLLLLVSFRSLVIPLTAAAMNLLSVAAVYGVIALVLEGGWAGELVGIDTATPMPAWLPVIVFAILFGLSMDYEVFLISRMRESWLRTRDNGRAIVDGLAGTGRVITAAAAIMVVVFAAFIPSDYILLKVIGIGMASAILIDATIVRMLLVPAVMHLLGRANWWLPGSLERRLPQLYVEGRPEVYLAEPATVAASAKEIVHA